MSLQNRQGVFGQRRIARIAHVAAVRMHELGATSSVVAGECGLAIEQQQAFRIREVDLSRYLDAQTTVPGGGPWPAA